MYHQQIPSCFASSCLKKSSRQITHKSLFKQAPYLKATPPLNASKTQFSGMNPKLSNNSISSKEKGKFVVFVDEKGASSTVFDDLTGEVMHSLGEVQGSLWHLPT